MWDLGQFFIKLQLSCSGSSVKRELHILIQAFVLYVTFYFSHRNQLIFKVYVKAIG